MPLTPADRLKGAKNFTKKKQRSSLLNLEKARAATLRNNRIREIDEKILQNRFSWAQDNGDRATLDAKFERLMRRRAKLLKQFACNPTLGHYHR